MPINGSRTIWREPKLKKYGITFPAVFYVPIRCVIYSFSFEEESTLTQILSFSNRPHIGVRVPDYGMTVKGG